MRILMMMPIVLAACVAGKPAEKPYFWKLVSIDGQPFTATATLATADEGTRAFGQAPCNSWSGDIVKDPFPTWAIRNVISTEMACADLPAEQAFFAAMAAMTHQSVGLGHLELVDQSGREMKFVPLSP